MSLQAKNKRVRGRVHGGFINSPQLTLQQTCKRPTKPLAVRWFIVGGTKVQATEVLSAQMPNT